MRHAPARSFNGSPLDTRARAATLRARDNATADHMGAACTFAAGMLAAATLAVAMLQSGAGLPL